MTTLVTLALLTLLGCSSTRGMVLLSGLYKNQTGDLPMSASQMDKVKARLSEVAAHSWEIGTQTHALIEYDWADLSVFSPGASSNVDSSSFAKSDVRTIVDRVVDARAVGQTTFWKDAAVGDPASIGVANLFVYATDSQPKYVQAAQSELDFLLNDAPRSDDGAISHRGDQVQLWADFISMAPPFIAYFGAQTNNASLLHIAHEQIKLYRQALLSSTSSGTSSLWKHIVYGDTGTQDPSHWSTGNAWAAHGILRVLYTIHNSPTPLPEKEKELVLWANEIINGAWAYQQDDGALLNHIDEPLKGNFVDMSGTVLLAAATFRLASFSQADVDIAPALKARKLMLASLDDDGWLLNVVNPLDWHQAGEKSPEGQAFVLMLEAAYRDWLQAS